MQPNLVEQYYKREAYRTRSKSQRNANAKAANAGSRERRIPRTYALPQPRRVSSPLSPLNPRHPPHPRSVNLTAIDPDLANLNFGDATGEEALNILKRHFTKGGRRSRKRRTRRTNRKVYRN